MEPESKIANTKLPGPYDNEVIVYHSNGLIWGTIAQWCSVLKAPYFIPEYLSKTAELQSQVMKGGPYTAVAQGEKIFRWPPIAAALDVWHTNWMRKVTKGEHTTMPQNKREASEQFAKNMAQLKQWGYELQERELQSAMAGKMTPAQVTTGMAEVNQAIQAIRSLAFATQDVLEKHEEKFGEHSVRLDDIEQRDPVNRDPKEFVTVKQRCLERALPFGVLVEGRMNLSQACGQYLQKSGVEKGATIKERLDASNIITDVATWRRFDIDVAIEHFFPELPVPRKRKKRDL